MEKPLRSISNDPNTQDLHSHIRWEGGVSYRREKIVESII